MLQAPPSSITVQCDARIALITLEPEKFDRTRFHLRFKRMWLGAVVWNADFNAWGCVTSEIPSEEKLEDLAIAMLEAYFAMACVSSPDFRDRVLAA